MDWIVNGEEYLIVEQYEYAVIRYSLISLGIKPC